MISYKFDILLIYFDSYFLSLFTFYAIQTIYEGFDLTLSYSYTEGFIN